MRLNSLLILGLLAASGWQPLLAQSTAAERISALKANLASSQATLRQYEWIETTTVAVKGDEKSRQQERCFYGADGKLTKVALTQPAPAQKARGLRGRIAEKKKEELTDYMKEAIALVKHYVPPDQTRIQAAKDAGRVSLQPAPGGGQAKLTFSDYFKAGDSFALDLDLSSNRPLSASVKTFLDSQKEPVTLQVTFGALNDGTTYPSEAVLEAQGKNLKVTVQNSGYRKLGQ